MLKGNTRGVGMYAASTSSTTTSGSRSRGTNPGTDGSVEPRIGTGERRVRVVRLLRSRRPAPAFGFSLRGGREHATGFFISKVELNSEAHHQGLKIGDQIVSVNGYRVEDAVHSELAHYLASQSRLKIKVRNVGMIPVKEKAHELLSWHFVSDRESISSAASSSPTLCHDTQKLQDLRLSILVPPRAKLGCGICKGPEWKPGIFVQFVRENGIAREAGLRPGDQILSCNGQDFTDISFNEAIATMKAPGRLELVVREGVGVELVSPESSGYNSSASSAAGERSPAPPTHVSSMPLPPPAALRHRLASVAEEAADRVDRLTANRIKRRTWDSLDFNWKNIHNFDMPSDIEPDYDSPSIPNNPHTYDNQKKDLRKKNIITNPSNRTIINLTENGATIQCSYDNPSPRKTTYSASQYQSKKEEKKTIVVEVHHSSCTQNGASHCNKTDLKNNDYSDTSSTLHPVHSTTLSNAIAEEILRRKLKKKEKNLDIETDLNVPTKNDKKTAVESEKKKQHDALMDEFKKVHRKMFANQDGLEQENHKHFPVDDGNVPLTSTDADRQPTLPLRKSNNISNGVNSAYNAKTQKEMTDNPPPPPPMPLTNGNAINGSKNGTPNIIKQDFNNSLNSNNKNGFINRIPTPDYNNPMKIKLPLKSVVKDQKSLKEEAVDLDSLESFKLKNPSSVQPKPPPTYFVHAPNGTATMKKHARPVSVTIGEYPSGGGRKEPSKLGFLNDKPNGVDAVDSVPISNRLQSELVMTLSRSNLRKKTDSTNSQINDTSTTQQNGKEDKYQSLDKNFHKRYGNNILPLPPTVTIPKVKGIKLNTENKHPKNLAK